MVLWSVAREREGWEGLQEGLQGCRTKMSGHWLVNKSHPLVTSLKTLREKKAHVSLFSLSESMPEEIMADLAWFSALFIVICSSIELL